MYQVFKFTNFNFGWCRKWNFLLDFAQQLNRTNADVPDIYFTLLDPAGISATLILNQNAKLKREDAWSLSKSDRQKLQRLYTQGGAAYGSLRKSVKASSISVSRDRQFLFSKPPYTKFTLATRNFKRMKSFARFKKEICCMYLAYVGKLANDKNGVKYLLVRQDLFDRNVDAKIMKKKDSEETVRSFLTTIKKIFFLKLWVDKEHNLLESLKKYAKLEEYKFTPR